MAGKLLNKHRWAVRIAKLRADLGMNQSAFATAVGTRQNNVSRWESGLNRPTPDLFARMAALAEGVDKFFFLEEAGLPKEFFLGGIEEKMPSAVIKAVGNVASAAFAGVAGSPQQYEVLEVPFLVDAVAAGSPLTVNEKDVARIVPLPADWFPAGAQMFGIKVEGDSMDPILREGDVVLVNTRSKDPLKLNARMVAVRLGEGCTIKWLRKSGKHWQLVPQNNSPRHEIRVLGEEDDWDVIGEIVKWLGAPPGRK